MALTIRQKDRRRKILSSARDMLTERGYDGMVMNQVARRANVSPTTLYNLYHTKDEMLLAALRDLTLDAARMTAAEIEEPGYEFILLHLHYSANQSQKGAAYARAITEALFRAKPGDELVEMMLTELSENVLISLKAMKTRGELRSETDLEELAVSMAGNYWSTFLLWTKGVIRLADLGRHLMRNFLSMLIAASCGSARTDLESRYSQLETEKQWSKHLTNR